MSLVGAWDVAVYDYGLRALHAVTSIRLCSTLPTTYSDATSTYLLGTKTSYTVPYPSDKVGGGREVVCPAVSGGSISANGSAGFYALVDDVSLVLYAARALSAPQTVTAGNSWSAAAFKQGIPASA